MTFDIDNQTIKDLELFNEKKAGKSVYTFYNHTLTKGGQAILYKAFNTPLADIEFLENRKSEIRFFADNNCGLVISSRQLDFIEYYLRLKRDPLKNNFIDSTYDGIVNKFKPDSDYYTISQGILQVNHLQLDLDVFLKTTEHYIVPESLIRQFDVIRKFLSSKTIKETLSKPPERAGDFRFAQKNKLDNYFRVLCKDALREVLNTVYNIDFLQSLSKVLKTEGFSLAEYISGLKPVFEVKNAFHPLLPDPVTNSFIFEGKSNLCFLTGPNMSGKSTFLKTMGLIVYLAHLGFPVPAKELRISIFNGLFTTINLADNINLGYSHYYAEVKRVKDIATKMSNLKNIVVIFDELFRGTNVKDAFDASLMIISALAKIRGNFFFISTHIIEITDNFDEHNNIMFQCFESDLIGDNPVYDFKLKNGISKERIGLQIIKNEKIIELLDQIIARQCLVL